MITVKRGGNASSFFMLKEQEDLHHHAMNAFLDRR